MRAVTSVHPFLDHDGPTAFAHRGGDVDGRENTQHAFNDAVALGYRYLETDLHVTADGVLVAFHDATLDRVTDGSGAIGDLPWSEVSAARVAGTDPVPRFEDLVAAFPTVRWNLDVKADGVVAPLIDRLRGDDDLLARVCVGSFSMARLVAMREGLGDALCTSAGPDEVRWLRYASLRGWGRTQGPIAADCLQVPLRHGRIPLVDRAFLAAAHRRGLPVHVWTINDAPTMAALLDRGVDGVMTDQTRQLREVLRQRGQWAPAQA